MNTSRFKIGDEVMVVEGAWSRVLDFTAINSPLKRVEMKWVVNGRHKKFLVLATNCKIPIEPNRFANTLIKQVGVSVVAAINDCNLFKEPEITIKFISNGVDVTDEISPQSKQAILKANIE